MSVRVVFLGPPGAGKGTQARELAGQWGVPQIATGDMLRAAGERGTGLGREARRYMDAGNLVPDQVVIGLVGERLAEADAKAGFVLDGFPRTVTQAEALDGLLGDQGIALDRVVFFDVSRPELLRRLTGRRICRRCGAAFHVVSAPPATAGRCDGCGGELHQRGDDVEETVVKRLDVYETRTAPLLDYYGKRGLLVRVPAEGAVADIATAIRRAVRAAAAS